MSQNMKNVEKLRLSLKSNEPETKTSTGSASKTSTPRAKSDSVKSTKGVTTRRANVKKPLPDKNVKSTPRKRSLTMTDIRSKMADVVRTPVKQMKQDSCSTTDYSPRSPDVHAEKMSTIRQRELQIRTFAKIFYNLWRKHKNLAENLKDEVSQLQLQKSFLINLRDKESTRREEITKIADKQKSEIIDLTEQRAQMIKEREILEDSFQKLVQHYNESIEYMKASLTDLDKVVRDENQQVIIQVKEINDLMVARFVDLKQTIRKTEEIDILAQQHLSMYICIKKERNEAIKTTQMITKATEALYKKLKTKEDNEKNLKETIRELRQALDNSNAKNLDLRGEVKTIELQLECAEQQLEELKFRPKTWTIIVQKAARLSMFILFHVGLLPTF